MDQFQRHLHAALISNKDLYPEIAGQARKNESRFYNSTSNPLLQSFTPRVEVYHELSLKRTILELQAPDRVGLLYQVSKVIFEHGFDITFARINTERGLAIDTFYIETPEKEEVSESPRLMELRDAITTIVTPETSNKDAVDY
jgi:[protein-PII] uridylyltransferase